MIAATGAISLAALMASAAIAQTEQNLTVGVPVASIANLDPHGALTNVQGNLQMNAQIFDTLVDYVGGAYVPASCSCRAALRARAALRILFLVFSPPRSVLTGFSDELARVDLRSTL